MIKLSCLFNGRRRIQVSGCHLRMAVPQTYGSANVLRGSHSLSGCLCLLNRSYIGQAKWLTSLPNTDSSSCTISSSTIPWPAGHVSVWIVSKLDIDSYTFSTRKACKRKVLFWRDLNSTGGSTGRIPRHLKPRRLYRYDRLVEMRLVGLEIATNGYP